MKSDVKAVVIGGSVDNDGSPGIFICLGAFTNVAEAYGEALLYLMDISDEEPSKKCTLTLPFKLECETGYGMYLKDENGKPTHYAFILFSVNDEESE